jgi:hypothetical protein
MAAVIATGPFPRPNADADAATAAASGASPAITTSSWATRESDAQASRMPPGRETGWRASLVVIVIVVVADGAPAVGVRPRAAPGVTAPEGMG